jgi:TonB family protein
MTSAWPVLLLIWPYAILCQSPVASPAVQAETVESKVYELGGDVVAPRLIPAQLPTISGETCNDHQRGKVTLNLVVDATGKPEQVYFANVLGTNLDRLAVAVVEAERFEPAIRDGIPVAVRESDELSLESCTELTGNASGKKVVRLKTQPSQVFKKFQPLHAASWYKNPEQPYPLLTPEAEFSEEARRKRVNGICVIRLNIDAHGLPEDPRVVRPVGYGLDEEAIRAIQKYRFRPALKNGQPVSMPMTIEVRFRQ